MTIETQSRSALRGLIDLLTEIDERWCSPEWNLNSEEDVAASHRALMHVLEAALVGFFETDPDQPDFRRIVTPSRKLTGDNSDAIYFDAPLSADNEYVVRGNMHGAAYFSLTLEEGTQDGTIPRTTGGVLNDTMIDLDSDGNFVVYLGGEKRDRNWLPMGDNASRVTTRHYFEHKQSAAGQPALEPVLEIERINPLGKDTSAGSIDERVATGIQRVMNFVRSRTLEQPLMANTVQPDFVGLTPNEFPKPIPPGDFGLAAFDAHYSMAPFFINSDEALVIRGRWPDDCRFANVCLWNRFQQTLDYIGHNVSFNRAQTTLEDDGSFTMVLAHQDPGHPNWLDTEGQLFGLVFWRYFLVEGDVVTPTATVVKFDNLDRELNR